MTKEELTAENGYEPQNGLDRFEKASVTISTVNVAVANSRYRDVDKLGNGGYPMSTFSMLGRTPLSN